MKNLLIIIAVSCLCVFVLSLASCDKILSHLFGLDGDIDITSPSDGAIVGVSYVTVHVEATYDYIDEIILEVNGEPVYSTDDNSFSHRVSLDPSDPGAGNGNIIKVTCYAYESEDDASSSYAGSDTIEVFYDNQDPYLVFGTPDTNWSTVSTSFTIAGNVADKFGVVSLSYLKANGIYEPISFDDPIFGDWSLPVSGLSIGVIYSYVFKVRDIADRTIVRVLTFYVDLP
jgi:hypothetical protein